MSKRKRILSEGSKKEIAAELGIEDAVEREGWGEVSSKDCGNIVKNAVDHGLEALKTKR